MIEKYDAFISYKHAPLDNRVADAIQKGLERYVLPKKVKEATGKQKIERIFRDKAELPITSNLDDNISYALENADFLIVICSKSTKLSTWVPREIEYFLQFHPISHVLTVLAEGEPGEVIPEILLKRKVLLTDAQGEPILDGQGRQQYVEKMMEPLSCDYRLPPAKAKKEELPRLAAAIAGCSYDELIMRARQYRMQRLAILGSAAAVLMTIAAAYLLWSRAEIQKNYNISQENLRQAQINQSVYLSHASETMFEIEHDGIGAAQLALAALGTQGEERPLVPQAIRALSQSIHAYTPEGLSTGRFPDGKYGAGSILLDFAVEKESGMIFLLDESGTASVFDISGQNCVYSRKFDDAYIERMFLLPAGNGKMAVCDGFSVFLLDWKQGKEMWRKDLWKNEAGEISDPEMAGAYKRNMANSYGLVSPDTFIPVAASLSPDGTMLAVDGMDDRIEIIDMVSGDTVRVFSADLLTMKSEPVSAWQKILWSEDQKYIAAAYLDEIADSEEIVLAVFVLSVGMANAGKTPTPEPTATPTEAPKEYGPVYYSVEKEHEAMHTDAFGNEILLAGSACANGVLRFTPGKNRDAEVTKSEMEQILGWPDYNKETGQGALKLGVGGSVILDFNAVIRDSAGVFLHVFTTGANSDQMTVSLSADAVKWYEVEMKNTEFTGADKYTNIPASVKPRYVKITDRGQVEGGIGIDAVVIFAPESLTKEETEYIIKNVREVVEYLRSFSPVWRDLMSGKAQFIL